MLPRVDTAPTGCERRTCFNCSFLNAADAAACEHCGANLRDIPLTRDIKMEAHLAAIAIWFRISGYLIALLGLIPVVTRIAWGPYGVRLFMSPLYALGIGLGSILLGVCLGRFSNIARIAAGILAALVAVGQGLAAFILVGRHNPLGIVFFIVCSFMCAVVCALFNRRAAAVCSEGYLRLVEFRRGVPPGTYRSPFFWVLFVGLALLVALVVWDYMTLVSGPPR
jgi:hypothetical protein